jgi:hypothetical protein
MSNAKSKSKVILLCVAADLNEIAPLIGQFADAASTGPDSRISQRWSLRIADTGGALTPHQELTATGPRSPDIVVEFSSDSPSDRGAMIDAALRVTKALDQAIDKKSSAAFVGEEWAITTGDGPVFLVMGIRARSDHSHEAFMQHWFGIHAGLGATVPGVRYKQNHIDKDASETLAERAGFGGEIWDGVTLSYFDDIETGLKVMTQPEVLTGLEDERLFINHARSSFDFFKVVA